jgi:AcrR family transcriptional regulator
MSDQVVEGRLELRKKPQQERSIQRLEAILEAAVELFVAKGIAETTMSEIAVRAGISIGSLYQFFPQKVAVIKALHDRFSARLEGFIQQVYKGVKTREEAADRAASSLIDLYDMFKQERIYLALGKAIAADRDLSQLSADFHEHMIATFYRDLAHIVPESEFDRFRANLKLMILTTGEVIRYSTQQDEATAKAYLDQWRRIIRVSLFAY